MVIEMYYIIQLNMIKFKHCVGVSITELQNYRIPQHQDQKCYCIFCKNTIQEFKSFFDMIRD